MTQHDAETLILQPGKARSLPHTMSATRRLTLTLVGVDANANTATLELHNPEAQPNEIVGGLIEENLVDVEAKNKWRDRLHLRELAVPVDTVTMAVEVLHCALHERLLIGDRVWTVTDIGDKGVTLTAGRDHEAHTLVNEVERLENSPEVIGFAEGLGSLDRDL